MFKQKRSGLSPQESHFRETEACASFSDCLYPLAHISQWKLPLLHFISFFSWNWNWVILKM